MWLRAAPPLAASPPALTPACIYVSCCCRRRRRAAAAVQYRWSVYVVDVVIIAGRMIPSPTLEIEVVLTIVYTLLFHTLMIMSLWSYW